MGRLLWIKPPEELRFWLTDSASLTRRLRAICGHSFRVNVLKQTWHRPLLGESQVLGSPHCETGVVRHVQLMCHDQPWVFARTVIPNSTLSGRRRRLVSLGNKPLGEMLFKDPSMYRGEVQVSQITNRHKLFAEALLSIAEVPASIWGRRSVFWIEGKPLLVNEIFLPPMVKWLRS